MSFARSSAVRFSRSDEAIPKGVVATTFGHRHYQTAVCKNKNMSEGENLAAGANAGEGQDQGADQNKQPETANTGSEDAGKGEGTEGAEGAQDTSKGQDDAKAPPKDTQPDDDGSEPPVKPRLSKESFIIARQRAKLAKGKPANEGDGTNEDEDEEFAPEDVNLITKVVSKQFAPIIDKSLATEDDKEISEFLTENPDFKPFEAKARRFMQHPSRRQLPIKSIFYEVAGDKLIRIGADREKAATEKAKSTQTGGGSNRAGEGVRSDWDLSQDEFEAKQEKIRHSSS